jgi:hypothetical protein
MEGLSLMCMLLRKKIGIDEPKFKVLKPPIKEPLLGSAKE